MSSEAEAKLRAVVRSVFPSYEARPDGGGNYLAIARAAYRVGVEEAAGRVGKIATRLWEKRPSDYMQGARDKVDECEQEIRALLTEAPGKVHAVQSTDQPDSTRGADGTCVLCGGPALPGFTCGRPTCKPGKETGK